MRAETAVAKTETPAVLAAPVNSAPVESLEGKSVYVIDAHSLIFQVFHAMPEMSSPTGQPTGAIHGFIRDIFDLLEKRKPDYLFVAFDMSGPTFRHELYDGYKAKRDELPTGASTSN